MARTMAITAVKLVKRASRLEILAYNDNVYIVRRKFCTLPAHLCTHIHSPTAHKPMRMRWYTHAVLPAYMWARTFARTYRRE